MNSFADLLDEEAMNNNQCICLEHIGDNGPCPEHGKGYASGAASLFATHTREPIDEGQSCLVCNGREGNLVFFGYDGALGETWVHTGCRQKAYDAIFRTP